MSLWLEELFNRQELDLDKFINIGYFTKQNRRVMSPERRVAFFDAVERSGKLARAILEKEGLLVTDDARTVQILLYAMEKRYDDALRIASHLANRYPANFLFAINRAQILERMGRMKSPIPRRRNARRHSLTSERGALWTS